jgi:hypothetical protein
MQGSRITASTLFGFRRRQPDDSFAGIQAFGCIL